MMAATLDKYRDEIIDGVPLQRIGNDQDMAGICIFLSSKAGSYISGATITVDGGITARAQL